MRQIAQNLGLFLACLMDRWVSVAMAANSGPINVFSEFTSRYVVFFAVIYFCSAVMVLDFTLRDYWGLAYDLPKDKIGTEEEARAVTRHWDRYSHSMSNMHLAYANCVSRARRSVFTIALVRLCLRLMFTFGGATIFVWALVDSPMMLKLYFLYASAYTFIITFQVSLSHT
jgi:hypothetical protein